MKSKLLLFILASLITIFVSGQSAGDYRSKQSGNWNGAANWERFDGATWVAAALPPTSTDGVITIRAGHSIVVNVNTTADQVIVATSATLTKDAHLTLNDGSGDDLTINGTIYDNAGVMSGTGNMVVAVGGVLNFSAGTPRWFAVPVTNNGTMNWQNGTIYFYNGTMTNAGTFNISGNNSMNNEAAPGGTFVNTGTITKTSSGLTDLLITAVQNSGTINVNAGTLQNRCSFTNTGNLNFNNGAFINGSPYVFNHNSGSVIAGTGSFTNDGTMNLNIDQTFSSTLSFAMGSSSVTTGPGNLTINNNLTMHGTIDGAGSLTINGNITWRAGTLRRSLTIAPIYSLTFANPSITGEHNIGAAITNNGTMNWQDGTIRFKANGILSNAGNFNISSDDPMLNENFVSATFTNTGTITKTSTSSNRFVLGTITNTNSGIIKGLGTLNIEIPTIFTSNGTIAPGLSPGILIMDNQQPFSANSTLSIEIAGNGGAGQPTGHDQLQRNNNLALNGTLTVNETGSVPAGDFTIISLASGTITGTFSTTNLPPDYTVIYNSNNVVVRKGQPVCVPAVSISANPGNSICSGVNVTFTATPTNGGTPSYQWKLNGNNVGTNSSTYSNSTLSNGDVVTVVLTSSLACASPTTATSTGITMTVTSTVAPSVSIAANPGNTICAGVNVTFTATPTNAGTPSYQWKLNNNNVGTNSNTYSSNSLATGDVVTVVMTSSLACASPNTATSTGITMTVTSTIAPSVSIAANPGNTICAGTNVTFTAMPTNGGTPSYQWKLNNNNVGTNSDTYSSNSLATGDVVTVVMTSSLACASPNTATSTGITMTVTPTVTPSVSLPVNPGFTICTGSIVTFTATPTNGGASPSYQWKLNGNDVGTNSNTYSNSGWVNGDQVSVVMTSSLACASPTTATSNVFTMTVTPTVTPSVIISANPGNTICAGTNVTFTATPTHGGTPSYQWKVNGNNVGTNSNTYSTNLLVTGDQVSVVMISSVPCSNPVTSTSNILTMTVSSTVAPSVSISANPGTVVCTGTNVVFTATPTNDGPTPSYQWKLNGNNVGINSSTYSSNSLANGDVVTVVMTSSLVCAVPLSATSNSMVISITSGGINAGIVAIGNRHRCPQTLQANPGGDVSYQWYKDGLGILGATERRYVANTNGKYSVRVTKNGCSVMSPETAVTACPSGQTRININKEVIQKELPLIRQESIHIYPNPASDYVTIKLPQSESENGEATVQLVTLHGQILLTQKLHIVKGRSSSTIKLNRAWKDGLYLVKVTVNNKIYVGKLIKIKP